MTDPHPTDNQPAQGTPPQVPPGRLGILFAMIPQVLVSIWRGQTNDALAAPFQAGRQLGSKHQPWLFTCAALSIFVGLSVLVGGVVNGLIAHGPGDWAAGVSAGGLLVRFAGPALITAALFLLRVLTVRWTFATRSITLGTAGAGNVVATSWHVYGAFWIIMLPLMMIPGITFGLTRLVVGGVLAFVVIIVAEILIYVGIARAVPAGQADPLMPHAMLTLVWALMIGIFLAIVGALVAATVIAMAIDFFLSGAGGIF